MADKLNGMQKMLRIVVNGQNEEQRYCAIDDNLQCFGQLKVLNISWNTYCLGPSPTLFAKERSSGEDDCEDSSEEIVSRYERSKQGSKESK